jgi:8-oxo-dGTP diphosphatase
MASSPIYSAVGLIQSGDLFLAVSRKTEHEDLGFPGGKIEAAETPEKAVIREVFEETGLSVARRNIRSTFVAPDPRGRLCMAFDISSYKGTPRSREGAWVGWVDPARLVDERNSFRDYNALVFESKGIPFAVPVPPPPEPEGLPLKEALKELIGVGPGHITFLYGLAASQLCPRPSVFQGLTFSPRDFAALLEEGVVSLRARPRLSASLVPSHLSQYIRMLGSQCKAAVLVTSVYRPTTDWDEASSNVIECQPHPAGVLLTLMKSRGPERRPTGITVVASLPVETTTA